MEPGSVAEGGVASDVRAGRRGEVHCDLRPVAILMNAKCCESDPGEEDAEKAVRQAELRWAERYVQR